MDSYGVWRTIIAFVSDTQVRGTSGVNRRLCLIAAAETERRLEARQPPSGKVIQARETRENDPHMTVYPSLTKRNTYHVLRWVVQDTPLRHCATRVLTFKTIDPLCVEELPLEFIRRLGRDTKHMLVPFLEKGKWKNFWARSVPDDTAGSLPVETGFAGTCMVAGYDPTRHRYKRVVYVHAEKRPSRKRRRA